jgi:hypothetical protein
MDQKQFEAMLSDAETRLRRLKMLYEQWFLGFERIEPAVLRKELEDLLGRLRKEPSNNTALRFRLQQLVQRHTTFAAHWRRIGRQIEEGTYQRDVLRAKRRKAGTGQPRDPVEPEPEFSYDVDLEQDLDAAFNDATRAVEQVPAPAVQVPQAVASEPQPTAAPKRVPVSAPLDSAAAAVLPAATAAIVPKGSAPPPAAAAGPRRSLSPFSMPPAKANPAAPPVNPPAAASGGAASSAVKAPAVVAAAATAFAKPGAVPSAAGVPRAASPKSTAVTPPAAASGGNNLGAFSTEDVERVYAQYLAARKQNAERTDNVKRDTIEKTIRTLLPQLEKKHAGKKIDFEVVVKDGKVALKPVAK